MPRAQLFCVLAISFAACVGDLSTTDETGSEQPRLSPFPGNVWGPAGAGDARCHAKVRVDQFGNPFATSGPTGYNPADLRQAYGLTTASQTNGNGQTVAIVDAFDDANAESDLGVYRAQFGLPPCTTANGCF